MTATATVLSMPLDTTVPSRTLRRLGRVGVGLVCSDIALLCLGRLGRLDLTLPKDGVDAGDLLLDLAQPGVVVELSGDVLEAQVEQLLLGLRQRVEQLTLAHLAELGGGRHQRASPARVTNLALMGSFWMARSMASLARG